MDFNKTLDYIIEKYDDLLSRLAHGPAPHGSSCFCRDCNEYWENWAMIDEDEGESQCG
jgi:hypothetical protein